VYPGWRVEIDGRTAPALAAGDLRAVDVPPGARRVVWTFTPPGARAGLAISFLSLSLLLGLALSPWLERYTPRGRARRSGAHPTG
jgi:uncharacterized membrane protein YfhO